jgi:hypothetical protein
LVLYLATALGVLALNLPEGVAIGLALTPVVVRGPGPDRAI